MVPGLLLAFALSMRAPRIRQQNADDGIAVPRQVVDLG